MFNFEAKQIIKEKEMNMRIEQKWKQEKSQRQLIKENTIVLLNQDIIYTKIIFEVLMRQ